MGPGLVVVGSALGYCLTGLLQRLQPVFIQVLITKRTVKALDVVVLRWAARLNQDVLDTVLLCSCHKCPASELRPVVSSDRLGVAAKHGRPIKQTGDVMPTNAKVGCDVYAFTREVVCYRQAFDAPGDGARPSAV